jgi:adenosylcobinamide-phosphate synthase
MVREVAHGLIPLAAPLAPDALTLIVAVAADLAVGDPVYAAHPVRLVGAALTSLENRLRRSSLDGYAGGIVLFVGLAGASVGLVAVTAIWTSAISALGWLVCVFLVYSLLALGDLLRHVRKVELAIGASDLHGARRAVSALVGRDTERMDAAACRRAAVESLSENLTDGFVSPILWYTAAGLPGLVLFKVVSTMDSMVGYKTPKYLCFGWCGARLDDLMNYLPARLTWLVMTAIAAALPQYSGRKAWRVGLAQHRLLPGPNAGWSESAMAGALRRRLVGPIWVEARLVTDLWIGEPCDPPLESAADVRKAVFLGLMTGIVVAMLSAVLMLALR